MMRSANTQFGFTLVEVLASLLIFSLAIIGLSQSGTQSIRANRMLEHKMLAGIVADNVLIEGRRAKPFRTGRQDGEEEQMGRDFRWTLEIKPTELEGFFQMTVRVNAPGSEQVVIVREAFLGADQ